MFEKKYVNDVMTLTPVAEKKCLNLLDFDVYHRLPTCKSIGFELFDNSMLIIPTNFPIISYLNLEEVYYTEKCLNLVHFMNNGLLKWNNYFGVYDLIAKKAGYVFEDVIKGALSEDFRANPQLLPRITRCLLRNFKVSSLNRNILLTQRFFFSILKLLFNFNCKDSKIVVEVLKTVCITRSVKEYILNGIIRPHLVDFILKHSICERFTVWNFLTDIHFCPVVESFYRRRVLHLKVLLDYGFKREERNTFMRCFLYNKYGSNEMNNTGISLNLTKVLVYRGDARRCVLIYDLLYLVCKVRCNLTVSNQWVLCAYYLFRSIPDPYISLIEFKAILPFLVLDVDNQLSVIYEVYKDFFAYIVTETHSPRKLRHLCRCTIRESLQQNFQLPIGIEKLNLPKILVSYLKLEW